MISGYELRQKDRQIDRQTDRQTEELVINSVKAGVELINKF